MNETQAAASDASALCMGCGLCCDGTLYGSVAVEAGETAHLERIGLRVITSDAPHVPQPCGALSGCLCRVYEGRPSACASYECGLRRDVRAASRDLREALAVVAEVRSLVDTIRLDLELDPARSIWEAIASLEAPATADAERAWAERHAGGLAAVVQLLSLVRAAIDPRFAGGGAR